MEKVVFIQRDLVCTKFQSRQNWMTQDLIVKPFWTNNCQTGPIQFVSFVLATSQSHTDLIEFPEPFVKVKLVQDIVKQCYFLWSRPWIFLLCLAHACTALILGWNQNWTAPNCLTPFPIFLTSSLESDSWIVPIRQLLFHSPLPLPHLVYCALYHSCTLYTVKSVGVWDGSMWLLVASEEWPY